MYILCAERNSTVTISFRGTLQVCTDSSSMCTGLIFLISHFLRITKSMKIQIYSAYGQSGSGQNNLTRNLEAKVSLLHDKIRNKVLSFPFSEPTQRLGSLAYFNK